VFDPRTRHRRGEFVEGQNPLRADGSELKGNAHTFPLLHRAGRGHEPKLPSEDGRILEAQVRLYLGQLSVGEGNEDTAQLTVLRLDNAGAHLSGEELREDDGGDSTLLKPVEPTEYCEKKKIEKRRHKTQ